MMRRILLAGLVLLGAGARAPLGDELYTRQTTSGVPMVTNVPRSGGQWRRLGAPDERRAAARPAHVPRPLGPPRFDSVVRRVAAHYGVDPRLVHAVIEVESGHDPRAVSPRGAVGLMQLMPATAAEMGIHDLKNPQMNIVAGVRHLRRLLDRYDGNVDLALAAYNAGAGAVSRHRGVPPFEETRRYIRRVRGRHAGSGLANTPTASRFTRFIDGNGVLVITQFPDSAGRRVVAPRPAR